MRTSLPADTRIDHRQVNRAGRKVRSGPLQNVGGLAYVLWGHDVAKIDQPRLGSDGEDHALHDPHVAILADRNRWST